MHAELEEPAQTKFLKLSCSNVCRTEPARTGHIIKVKTRDSNKDRRCEVRSSYQLRKTANRLQVSDIMCKKDMTTDDPAKRIDEIEKFICCSIFHLALARRTYLNRGICILVSTRGTITSWTITFTRLWQTPTKIERFSCTSADLPAELTCSGHDKIPVLKQTYLKAWNFRPIMNENTHEQIFKSSAGNLKEQACIRANRALVNNIFSNLSNTGPEALDHTVLWPYCTWATKTFWETGAGWQIKVLESWKNLFDRASDRANESYA